MKLLIVEGTIGSGKSTLTHTLREKMKHTQLLSLSSLDSTKYVFREDDQYLFFHESVLEFCRRNLGNSNIILCRSYLSDYIYYKLNHKSSDYEGELNYKILSCELKELTKIATVEIIILITNEEELKTRLNRDKFQLIEHTVEEAVAQQEEYLKVGEDLKQKGFNVRIIDNSTSTVDEVVDMVMKG